MYKHMRVGSTRNTKAIKKQKMGTYSVNIYGWLMCKLTVTQRTIENKTNMQYIFKIICILQSLYTGRTILKG
jgi:hypothetical protein